MLKKVLTQGLEEEIKTSDISQSNSMLSDISFGQRIKQQMKIQKEDDPQQNLQKKTPDKDQQLKKIQNEMNYTEPIIQQSLMNPITKQSQNLESAKIVQSDHKLFALSKKNSLDNDKLKFPTQNGQKVYSQTTEDNSIFQEKIQCADINKQIKLDNCKVCKISFKKMNYLKNKEYYCRFCSYSVCKLCCQKKLNNERACDLCFLRGLQFNQEKRRREYLKARDKTISDLEKNLQNDKKKCTQKEQMIKKQKQQINDMNSKWKSAIDSLQVEREKKYNFLKIREENQKRLQQTLESENDILKEKENELTILKNKLALLQIDVESKKTQFSNKLEEKVQLENQKLRIENSESFNQLPSVLQKKKERLTNQTQDDNNSFQKYQNEQQQKQQQIQEKVKNYEQKISTYAQQNQTKNGQKQNAKPTKKEIDSNNYEKETGCSGKANCAIF